MRWGQRLAGLALALCLAAPAAAAADDPGFELDLDT